MLLVLPYSALAQDSATAASVEADEEQAKRNRAGDERFECVPPERPEPVLEDLGFDQYALPLDSMVAGGQLASSAEGAESAAGEAEIAEGAEGEGAAPAGPVFAEAAPEDFDAWRDAVERFKARAGEFNDEIGRLIRRDYDEEVGELRTGYDSMVDRTDLEERLLRDKAIEAHEKFVKKHPASPYTARRMFRLAELYFERSGEEFMAEEEKWYELQDKFDAGKVKFLPPPPEKDYRSSIALYKKIIRNFKDYGDLGAVYDMLGYCYSDETGRHLDPVRAAEVYRALLANVPDSQYRAGAYLRLGNLHFEENETTEGLRYFNQMVADFDEQLVNGPLETGEEQLYEMAKYKVAWSLYKLDDLEPAMQKFMELIDWAEAKEARTGRGGDLKAESIRYLAIAINDRASELEISPVLPAARMVEDRGTPTWSYEVIKELAGILMEQVRYEDAIDTYLFLQEKYPLSPDGPVFQNNVIELYSIKSPPDLAAASAARVALSDQYGLNSAWYEANKNNVDAIEASKEYILDSLYNVAVQKHQDAQESGEPSDFLVAALKYEEYLSQYPYTKNAYELSWYLAECYFEIGNQPVRNEDGQMITGWERAIIQYSRLFGFPEDEYRKQAIEAIAVAYQLLWIEREGGYKTDPASLHNLKPTLGETVEFAALPLSPLSQKYIQSVRWVEKELPDAEGLPAMLYHVGDMLYFSNNLESARAVFNGLIERYPATEVAGYAADLIVTSYLYTGDLEQMRQQAERFAALTLGADEENTKARNVQFASWARQSLLSDGTIAYSQKRYECALNAFLDFYALYGEAASAKDMQKVDTAVYNIAASYSKLGRTEESNEYYELLLARFPESPQAAPTFWRMASNYERTLELEKAVSYYEDLLTYHPNNKDAINALANAATLKVGLKRFGDAAASKEKYHDQYTDKDDAKDQLFGAAELWESAGNPGDAERVYKRWLKLYGDQDADRWVQTQYKLAEYAGSRRKARDQKKIIQLIYDSYPDIKADLGGTVGLRLCAEIAFRPLLADFAEYEKLQFPNTKDQDAFKKVYEEKLAWNKKLAADLDAFTIEYPDFLWQSAAFYYKALSYKRHGETWVAAPIPFDVDNPNEEEYYYAYSDQMIAQAARLDEFAVKLFEAVVDAAQQKKLYTEWVDKALAELSVIDPNSYALPKPEESTVIPSESLRLPPAIEEPPEISAAPVRRQGTKLALGEQP